MSRDCITAQFQRKSIMRAKFLAGARMKSSAIALFLSTLLYAASAIAQSRPLGAVDPEAGLPAFMKEPGWLGQKYFGEGDYAKLDAVVEDYTKSGKRTEDGRYALQLLSSGLENWLGLWDEGEDARMARKLSTWRERFPESAFQPIVAAMHMDANAWRARGKGYASTVTEEGWRLFNERSQRAWNILIENKAKSSVIPTWYDAAIGVGGDANVSDEQLRELFDEGVRRYPGYHPIYFAFLRQFAPRWGGNYADADEFILEQTAAKTNPDGEILYTRLYWSIDALEGRSPSFFQDSKVSWPRMRRGFELMMQAYPDSTWNAANFAIYACRARDATVYATLRPKIDAAKFKEGAPQGISMEVCDARFMKKI
jgi:hypothetical protein